MKKMTLLILLWHFGIMACSNAVNLTEVGTFTLRGEQFSKRNFKGFIIFFEKNYKTLKIPFTKLPPD